MKDPVNEPVLICVDEETNPSGLLVIVSHVLAAPLTYEAVTAKLAVLANDAVATVHSNACVELETVPMGSMVGAYDAVTANDELMAREEEAAQLLVPVNGPINVVAVADPLTTNDPVISKPFDIFIPPDIYDAVTE